MAKIIDEIKASGAGERAKVFIRECNKRFELGTINTDSGKMRFFGINTIQHDYMTVATNTDDELNTLTDYARSRLRLKQFDIPINELERALFASTNSLLG